MSYRVKKVITPPIVSMLAVVSRDEYGGGKCRGWFKHERVFSSYLSHWDP